MKNAIPFFSIMLLILGIVYAAGCSGERAQVETDEPVVLEEGSTADHPEYYVDEDGRVVYLDSRTSLDDKEDETEINEQSSEEQELIDAIPVFPGAQRIYPAGENPELRKSFIARAPMDAIESFYKNFLAYGVTESDAAQGEPENMVNSITSVNENRRQTTLFVNPDSGERGAMKVLLKEFPAQHAVQIVHTTLYATPSGLDPVGIYVTPEELEELAEQAEADDSGDNAASGEGD